MPLAEAGALGFVGVSVPLTGLLELFHCRSSWNVCRTLLKVTLFEQVVVPSNADVPPHEITELAERTPEIPNSEAAQISNRFTKRPPKPILPMKS